MRLEAYTSAHTLWGFIRPPSTCTPHSSQAGQTHRDRHPRLLVPTALLSPGPPPAHSPPLSRHPAAPCGGGNSSRLSPATSWDKGPIPGPESSPAPSAQSHPHTWTCESSCAEGGLGESQEPGLTATYACRLDRRLRGSKSHLHFVSKPLSLYIPDDPTRNQNVMINSPEAQTQAFLGF